MAIGAKSELKVDIFGAWCCIFYLILLFIGWGLVAEMIPPLNPSAGAAEVASIFREAKTRIIVGMILVLFSSFIFIPFIAVFTRYISKAEGSIGTITYIALLGGVGNMVTTFYPGMTWLIAAFRPDRGDDFVYLMSDAAWLQFVGGPNMLLGMPLALALAAFLDKDSNPIFPKWSGYFSIWIVLLIVPDQLLFFFYDGPFAWNGLIGLWIPVVGFGAWFIVAFYLIRKYAVSQFIHIDAKD